jgi:hypothetical protein
MVQADDHPHGGGLSGTVGTEEPGDDAVSDLEREIVDRHGLSVPLRQPGGGDHAATLAAKGAEEFPASD